MSDEPVNGKPVEEHHPRQVTDIVIPFEVWKRQDLTRFEIVVYAEIRSLSKGPRGCFATNRYLAGFLGCTTRHLQRCLRRLHETALLSVERIEGEQPNVVRRVLRALRPWDTDPEWSGRSYPRSAETEDEPDEPPPSQGGVTPRSGGGRHRSHPDKGQVESLESPLPPTPAPSLRDSLVVQSSNEPQSAAAASLYIYRASARHYLNEQAPPKENVPYTDSGLRPDKQAPLSIYETEQQQTCNCELRSTPSEQENVSLAVHARENEKLAASNVGEQAIEVSGTARETERTLDEEGENEPLGLAAFEPGVAAGGSVGGSDGGADAGGDGEPAVRTEAELDASYRRLVYGRERGEGDAAEDSCEAVVRPGSVRPGGLAAGRLVKAVDALGEGDGPDGVSAALDAGVPGGGGGVGAGEAGEVGGGDVGAGGDVLAGVRVGADAHKESGDVGGLDGLRGRADAVDAGVAVTLTDTEEWEGAAALLVAWAGGAITEQDALSLTRRCSCQRVLQVTGRAEERPAGMRVGFVIKALRDNLPVAPPARAAPAVEHRREREVENGIVAGEVTTPPVSRDEQPLVMGEEERAAFSALKARLLSNMRPDELAWVSQRRQERQAFGKPVREVDGLTPIVQVLPAVDEVRVPAPEEHEPRDHLRWAA